MTNSDSGDDQPASDSDQPGAADRWALRDWLPVLRRGSGAVQVGLDPDASLVFSGVPEGTEDVLALLDGTHTTTHIQLRAAQLGLTAEQTGWMLRMIDSAGLLYRVDTGQHGARADRRPAANGTDATPASQRAGPIRDSRIRLVGSGVLAHAVAVNLMTAGIGHLYLADPGAGGGPGIATLQARLAAEPASTRLQLVNHWSKPERPSPDLTVVAAGVTEPRRTIGDGYVRADHRHLFVRPLGGGAIVGPMVHPGRSPCLCCLDQARRDADPCWPGLMHQLGRHSPPVTPLLAQWSGVTATTQILAELGGRMPSTAGATIEMTPADFATRVRRWSMHPGCGCAWQG